MEITTIIIMTVIVGLVAVVGFFYAKGVTPHSSTSERADRYMYVMNNKHKFKVNNKGSSLDNSGNVYLIQYKKIGL